LKVILPCFLAKAIRLKAKVLDLAYGNKYRSFAKIGPNGVISTCIWQDKTKLGWEFFKNQGFVLPLQFGVPFVVYRERGRKSSPEMSGISHDKANSTS